MLSGNLVGLLLLTIHPAKLAGSPTRCMQLVSESVIANYSSVQYAKLESAKQQKGKNKKKKTSQ